MGAKVGKLGDVNFFKKRMIKSPKVANATTMAGKDVC